MHRLGQSVVIAYGIRPVPLGHTHPLEVDASDRHGLATDMVVLVVAQEHDIQRVPSGAHLRTKTCPGKIPPDARAHGYGGVLKRSN